MTFDETKQYVKQVRKIDAAKFNTVKEFTLMIDYLNKEKEKENDRHFDNEVNAISKYYANAILREIQGPSRVLH